MCIYIVSICVVLQHIQYGHDVFGQKKKRTSHSILGAKDSIGPVNGYRLWFSATASEKCAYTLHTHTLYVWCVLMSILEENTKKKQYEKEGIYIENCENLSTAGLRTSCGYTHRPKLKPLMFTTNEVSLILMVDIGKYYNKFVVVAYLWMCQSEHGMFACIWICNIWWICVMFTMDGPIYSVGHFPHSLSISEWTENTKVKYMFVLWIM